MSHVPSIFEVLSDGFYEGVKHYDEQVGNKLGLPCGPKCCVTNCVATLTAFALFIIGCMGVAGAFPGANMGWVVIGLGGGLVLMSLAGGQFKKRLWTIIPTALAAMTLFTVGGLNVAGILSNVQLGIALLLISIASEISACIPKMMKLRSNLPPPPNTKATHQPPTVTG